MIPTGQLLKFYREMRNFTPEVLAEAINLNYRTYLKIESGHRDLKVPELIKLSEKLEISPDKLYSPESTFNSFNNFTSNSSCVDNTNSNQVTLNKDILKTIQELLRIIASKLDKQG